MNKKVVFLALLVALAGSAEARAIRQSIDLYGAGAADQALETAVWQICPGM